LRLLLLLLDDAETITVLVLFEEEVPLFLFFFAKKTSRRLEKRNFVLFPTTMISNDFDGHHPFFHRERKKI
jgi:hypothetical protein